MSVLLVVDDDPLIAAMLRLVLESEGYDVRQASDGREALESVRDQAPAAVVLDLMMPEVDGLGVLRELRAGGLHDTRVVMLTCCSQEDDVRRCLEAGADDYFTKPVDVDGLLQAVRDLLEMDESLVRKRREEIGDESALAGRVGTMLSR